MEKQVIRKRFGGLMAKVGLIILGGLALVSCREKKAGRDSNYISDNNYVEKVVDENEFTIPYSDRTKSSFVTPSKFLWDGSGDYPNYVRYHGISKDGEKFILSSDSNTPFIISIGLGGGKKALDNIKPPLKPCNNYYIYPLDSKQIALLNKNYGVVSVDPNQIILRKVREGN